MFADSESAWSIKYKTRKIKNLFFLQKNQKPVEDFFKNISRGFYIFRSKFIVLVEILEKNRRVKCICYFFQQFCSTHCMLVAKLYIYLCDVLCCIVLAYMLVK